MFYRKICNLGSRLLNLKSFLRKFSPFVDHYSLYICVIDAIGYVIFVIVAICCLILTFWNATFIGGLFFPKHIMVAITGEKSSHTFGSSEINSGSQCVNFYVITESTNCCSSFHFLLFAYISACFYTNRCI